MISRHAILGAQSFIKRADIDMNWLGTKRTKDGTLLGDSHEIIECFDYLARIKDLTLYFGDVPPKRKTLNEVLDSLLSIELEDGTSIRQDAAFMERILRYVVLGA